MAAHWLSQAARASSSGCRKLLAPLLYAAASSGRSMEDIIGWLNSGMDAEAEVRDLLVKSPEPEEALSAWKANRNREERHRSSIYTTAETILSTFSDPRVLPACAGSSAARDEAFGPHPARLAPAPGRGALA